jgi:catechol 2,3-dioxygenase-like lactoylglutathione lyase family enzyme
LAQPLHFYKLVMEVTDLERSERFYRDDLGLQPLGRNLWPDDGDTATFRTADGAHVVLVQVAEIAPVGLDVHRNFMLPEEDYFEVFERLQERGWLRPNHRTEMGVRSATEITCSLYDPDRNRLQLTAWRRPYHVPAAMRGKVVAGRIDDFAEGSVTYVGEGKFFVLRLPDGFLALNNVCTHLQANVVYQPEHYQYYCFCHGRMFDQVGRQVAIKVDVPPLEAYAIEFVDGQVVVDTDHSIPRSDAEADSVVPLPDAALSEGRR